MSALLEPSIDNFIQVMCDYQKAHNITKRLRYKLYILFR